jgi:hypothetical protein
VKWRAFKDLLPMHILVVVNLRFINSHVENLKQDGRYIAVIS